MGERLQRTATTNAPVLRVKRVKVEGLFGLYNHDIPLNLDDRVTIVHGPNGVGKTVLLKLIAAVFSGEYEQLAKVPFKQLSIEFSGDGLLSLIPDKFGDERDNDNQPILVSLKSGTKTRDGTITIEKAKPAITSFAWDAIWEPFGRHGQSPFQGKPSGATDAARRIMGPKWLTDLRTRVQVHLIETQRLLRMNFVDERGAFIPTVREYARDLHARITEALARYATESQSLDQSFPQRLLKTRGQTGLVSSDLKSRMSALNDKRAQLQKIGLLDAATSSPFEIESLDVLDPVQSNVMSLYVEDTQRKLEVLGDLSRRITLLLDNVNGKFRNKSIQISRQEGFVVLGHDGAPIEPDSLSSGEQHELVQLYDLLFRVKPGTLVLIDEPELSLHVLWQKKYLPELLEIAKTAEFDAIVATHSPFIVGDRSDLMVPLTADIDT
ncbi:MAG: AAA family ATPase [Polyangiaceae bacterium]|nr:AAA family ATPase [Polyangiaceae bacterium]